MATEAERIQINEMRQDLTTVQRDIALLNQFNAEVTKPTLSAINEKLDRLNFYTKIEVDTKLRDLQKKRWYENTLSATFGALLTGAVMFIFNHFVGR